MVMPLWDHNPFAQAVKPWTTWGLILVNVIAYVFELGTIPDNISAHVDATILGFGVVPAAVIRDIPNAGDVPAAFSLLTYQFIHADVFHLLGNMIFLWVFGDDVEEALGPGRFLAFYLLCGIAGGATYVLGTPHSGAPLCGASGAIAGVLAGYLMFRPCQKVWVIIPPFPLHLDAFWVIGSWVLVQLWQVTAQADDGVSYLTHVGGFIAGIALFLLLRRPNVTLFECTKTTEPPVSPPSGPWGADGITSR